LGELAHAWRCGAKFPELVHAFRGSVAVQIAPKMKLNRRLPGDSPFSHNS
jgi:hypothetical protein